MNYYHFNKREELESYMGEALSKIANILLEQDFICEGQCDKLSAEIIEDCAGLLRESLSELTGENIVNSYAPNIGYFLYACNRITLSEALSKIELNL